MDEIRDTREPGWYWLDNAVLDRYGGQMGPEGIAVYNVLVRRANSQRKCWPSIKNICELTGIKGKPTVYKALATLKEIGLISIEHRTNEDGGISSNLYTLLAVPVVAVDPIPSPDDSKGDLPGSNPAVPGSKGDLPGSKPDLPPLVKEDYHPSKQIEHEQDPLNKTQFEEQIPSGAFAPATPSAISLADQFQTLKRRLESAKGNERPVILLDVFKLCFGEQGEMPAFGYLGQVAKSVGGAGRLADLMWQLTTRPPTGDVLAYITKAHGEGTNGHSNGQRPIRNSLAVPEDQRVAEPTEEDKRAVEDLRQWNRERKRRGAEAAAAGG